MNHIHHLPYDERTGRSLLAAIRIARPVMEALAPHHLAEVLGEEYPFDRAQEVIDHLTSFEVQVGMGLHDSGREKA